MFLFEYKLWNSDKDWEEVLYFYLYNKLFEILAFWNLVVCMYNYYEFFMEI